MGGWCYFVLGVDFCYCVVYFALIMQPGEQKSQLQRYTALKNEVELPVKVKLYFLIFENSIENNKAPRTLESKKGFSKALLNAFTNLSLSEKGHYLLNSLNFVLDHMDWQEKDKTKSDSRMENMMDQIKQIETTCEMVSSTMKISHWSTVSFKLDKIKRLISITNKKKNSSIQIKNYYVRRSKKHKSSIVMQAITEDVSNQGKKYIFCFSPHVVHRIYDEILKCVFFCQHDKLLAMLMQDQEDDKSSKMSSHISNSEKALVFLSSKNINDYLGYKDKVCKQIMTNKFDFKPILTRDGLTIEQSFKMEKIFKLENTFEMESKQLKEKFMYAFNHKNKFILHSQVLEEFSKKYRAVYEKYLVGGKVHEFIAIREETITSQEQILFIKGIENIMNKIYLEFLQVRVRTLNPFKSRLIMYCSMNLTPIITRDVVKALLVEMNDMILRKESTEVRELEDHEADKMEAELQEDQDDFKTVKGSEQFVEFIEDDAGGELNTSRMQAIELSLAPSQTPSKYLFKKHITSPLDLDDESSKIFMKSHYLFKEWVRVKNGGVVCTNEAIINVQKNLFKSTITKMGRSILKGQFLKLSLPVTIFKKESHLVSIGRDFCFAPMFFDRFVDSPEGQELEKVKYASLLAVSVGTLGISMQKPFNPVLGETFQGWIGGCPIYLEQISHHPPIGAYYMQGRGYKIHGQIEPKISFGMNNVKGYSDRPNFLRFDDGTVIEMTYGKMVIKGMMFGEREFNFQDKIYAYDKKNHIFSEICYGPRKKSMLKKKAEPLDFFHGTIYQVKPEFVEKFEAFRPKMYPTPEYIVKELSTFEGVWNEVVTFDGVEYINFKTDLPHELVPEEDPLLSNPSFRGDLIKLLENDVVQAQVEKQHIEEIQRRDRRLRQKYSQRQH